MRRAMCCVLAITVIAGCKGARKPAAKGADTVEEQGILGKLQSYLTCLDAHGERIFGIADRYRHRFAAAPPGPNTDKQLLLSPIEPEKCAAWFVEAKGFKPELPKLEKAGEAYIAALAELDHATKLAQTTFGGDKIGSDAAAVHARVLAAFDGFDVAHTALFDETHGLYRTARHMQLTRREATDQRNLVWLVDWMMFLATDLVKFSNTPWDKLDRLDVSAIDALITSLESTIVEASERARAYAKEADDMDGFDILANAANAVLAAARQLRTRARDKVPFSDSEKLVLATPGGTADKAAVPGTPAALVQAHNRLVELYFKR